jgi:hypothetical protein
MMPNLTIVLAAPRNRRSVAIVRLIDTPLNSPFTWRNIPVGFLRTIFTEYGNLSAMEHPGIRSELHNLSLIMTNLLILGELCVN